MSHGHEHGHEHEHPHRKRSHWKWIVVAVLMLAAMGIYVLSLDESIVPAVSGPAATTASAPASQMAR
ncbi:MAG: hypothetical protein WC869_05020 [Phycisphaerae bacterium]|jgi:hypothetical protein